MKYTKESLQNTWGIVESEEHAEFIIELARSAGLITSDTWNNAHDYFSINYNGLLFWIGKSHAESRGEKQITIPLPPKAKEWPQVGDEVLIDTSSHDVVCGQNVNGLIAKVLSIFKDNDTTVYAVNRDGVCYCFTRDILKKPKSKQDLLIEELQTKLCNNNAVDNYILACDIINGEIEGLSYV